MANNITTVTHWTDDVIDELRQGGKKVLEGIKCSKLSLQTFKLILNITYVQQITPGTDYTNV